MIGGMMSAAIVAAKSSLDQHKFEELRWNSLTKEEQDRELRVREVIALEVIAEAKKKPPVINVSLF